MAYMQIIKFNIDNIIFSFDNFFHLLAKIIFLVFGYGHGVGMSQHGAQGMAKEGYDYVEIIQHYYKDVEIVNK